MYIEGNIAHDAGGGQNTYIPLKEAEEGNFLAGFRKNEAAQLTALYKNQPGAVLSVVNVLPLLEAPLQQFSLHKSFLF
jgi:hypothetical protein